jgi:hypothetical protein
MASSFSDVNWPPVNGSISTLRGLLPVPREVEAVVAREEASHPMTPEFRQTFVNRLTLQFYFEDVDVAFRRTPQGIEVLAAGADEIGAFVKNTPAEQRQGVIYGQG